MNAKKSKRLRQLARQFVLSNYAREQMGEEPRPLSIFAEFSHDEKKKIAKEIACEMDRLERRSRANEAHGIEAEDSPQTDGVQEQREGEGAEANSPQESFKEEINRTLGIFPT